MAMRIYCNRALLCIALGFAQSVFAEDVVRLSTWPSYGKNAGFQYAKSRGYYGEAGIRFEVLDSFQHSLLHLHSGNAEVAQVFVPEAVARIDQGVPFIVVAIRDATSPLGTVSLADGNIRSPKDYAYKRWGHSTSFSPELRVIGWLGKLQGFDPATIRISHVDFRLRLATLLRGDVDFISAWWGSGYPALKIAAQKEGKQLQFLRWSDYGIDVYGEALVVRKDWALANAKLLKRFLAATARGFLGALEDEEGALEAALRAAPPVNANPELIRQGWTQSKELLFDTPNRMGQLFYMDEVKFNRTLGVMEPPPSSYAASYMTNEYLPHK